jgi:hypothetical protein
LTVHRSKRLSPRLQMPFIALILLCCAAGARGSILTLTIINATFSATCIGGGPTCTEVVNGSAFFNTATNNFSGITMQLTGTLALSLNSFAPAAGPLPPCVSPLCLPGGEFLYHSPTLPGQDPIEFGPAFPSLSTTSSPQPLVGGPTGTGFYIPTTCGGNQPLCNTTGSFPSGDFVLASGTYTLVSTPAPEPSAGILLVTGAGMMGFLLRRKPRRTVPSRNA